MSIIEGLRHILYVRRCLFCAKPIKRSEDLCERCGENLRYHFHPRICSSCKELYQNCSCAYPTVSVFYYEEPVTHTVARFKFHGERAVAKQLARFMKNKYEESGLEGCDLIAAVPLYKTDYDERGYSQSDWLADELSKLTGIPYDSELVVKIRRTEKQRTLDMKSRRTNLKNAFACADKEKAAGKRILLVDDVMTSGCTLKEVIKVLKASGAKEIISITAAKTRFTDEGDL